MFREVFFVSEGHRKPETYCAKRVTENGVNSNFLNSYYILWKKNFLIFSQMRDNMINVRGSRRPKGFRGFSVEII